MGQSLALVLSHMVQREISGLGSGIAIAWLLAAETLDAPHSYPLGSDSTAVL